MKMLADVVVTCNGVNVWYFFFSVIVSFAVGALCGIFFHFVYFSNKSE